MSTGAEQQSPRHRSVLYVVVTVVLVILAVWAVIAFSTARESQRAEKATELVQVLQDAGATAAPAPEVVTVCSATTAAPFCAAPTGHSAARRFTDCSRTVQAGRASARSSSTPSPGAAGDHQGLLPR